jgi:hypothetical protein
MLRLEKPASDLENTTLKAPASKNLYNVRVDAMIRAVCIEISVIPEYIYQ